MNNICRICLEKGVVPHKLTPIFDPIKPPHFPNLIMACAQVEVVQGDGLPTLICNKCIARLNVAFQFKQECEDSDAKLREYFNSVQPLPAAPDFTGFALDIKKDPLPFDDQQIQQQPPQEQEMQPQVQVQLPPEETIQTVQITQEIIEATNEELNNLKDESSVKEEEFAEIKTDNNSTINITKKEPSKKKQCKQHQCDTCGKVFRTKPGLIHHIRIHTGERPYLCHLCNKRFINGGHLHTHMRTHTGEKNHVCCSCSKAFATAQQLTKHTIAIHTSERPYACTYCPKRFASSSNLNTHVKIHTGEKNYHCDQCGKAFSTKGQLYQHMLVHTGIKAFLCEYCHKRFSQKAHLIRHLKMHK